MGWGEVEETQYLGIRVAVCHPSPDYQEWEYSELGVSRWCERGWSEFRCRHC